GASVYGYTADGYESRISTRTDASGAFTATGVVTGDYKFEFLTDNFPPLWAHHADSFDTADAFTVVADTVTVVEETQLPTGSVAVTAADQATGQPLTEFCVA